MEFVNQCESARLRSLNRISSHIAIAKTNQSLGVLIPTDCNNFIGGFVGDVDDALNNAVHGTADHGVGGTRAKLRGCRWHQRHCGKCCQKSSVEEDEWTKRCARHVNLQGCCEVRRKGARPVNHTAKQVERRIQGSAQGSPSMLCRGRAQEGAPQPTVPSIGGANTALHHTVAGLVIENEPPVLPIRVIQHGPLCQHGLIWKHVISKA